MPSSSSSQTVTVLVDALRGLVVLTLLWACGEGLAAVLPSVPLTGSLWGMVFLFALLWMGWLPEALIRRASAALLRVLGLLFVPVGVGIVAYGPLVVDNALALIVAIALGSLMTLLVVAAATTLALRR